MLTGITLGRSAGSWEAVSPLRQAIREPRSTACGVNYGVVPTSRADIQKINTPVLGRFGALDRGIPPRKL